MTKPSRLLAILGLGVSLLAGCNSYKQNRTSLDENARQIVSQQVERKRIEAKNYSSPDYSTQANSATLEPKKVEYSNLEAGTSTILEFKPDGNHQTKVIPEYTAMGIKLGISKGYDIVGIESIVLSGEKRIHPLSIPLTISALEKMDKYTGPNAKGKDRIEYFKKRIKEDPRIMVYISPELKEKYDRDSAFRSEVENIARIDKLTKVMTNDEEIASNKDSFEKLLPPEHYTAIWRKNPIYFLPETPDKFQIGPFLLPNIPKRIYNQELNKRL